MLLKNVQYILPPDIDLTQNMVASKFNEKEDAALLSRCEKCGKVLEFQYYLFVGISPSSSVIKAIRCSNLNDEKVGVESVIDEIRFEGKDFDIVNQYQWIFSDENIMNSKTRVCVSCYEEEYKEHVDVKDIHFIAIRIRTVYFAVEEYQRRHAPIDSAKSDIERYRISLPDRSMVALIGPGGSGLGLVARCGCRKGC